jgi:hypothetical protein
VRRTSFVGAGFIGMRNPGQFGRAPSTDELHPFLAVVSNAQDLTEQWRSVVDQEFATYLRYLDRGEPFLSARQWHSTGMYHDYYRQAVPSQGALAVARSICHRGAGSVARQRLSKDSAIKYPHRHQRMP